MDRERALENLIADQLEQLTGPHSQRLLRVPENGVQVDNLIAEFPRDGLKAEFELPAEPLDDLDDEEEYEDDEIRLLKHQLPEVPYRHILRNHERKALCADRSHGCNDQGPDTEHKTES